VQPRGAVAILQADIGHFEFRRVGIAIDTERIKRRAQVCRTEIRDGIDPYIIRQTPVRVGIVWRLLKAHMTRPIEGAATLRVLRAYRRAQEILRFSHERTWSDLATAQVLLAAQLTSASSSFVSMCVARWMEQELRSAQNSARCVGVALALANIASEPRVKGCSAALLRVHRCDRVRPVLRRQVAALLRFLRFQPLSLRSPPPILRFAPLGARPNRRREERSKRGPPPAARRSPEGSALHPHHLTLKPEILIRAP
jgi:hypothetical protein